MEKAKGYGVVGTWVHPNKLGGALPLYLTPNEAEAKEVGIKSPRLMEFANDTEQWLCEITIKPIKRLRLATAPKFVKF